MFKIRKAFSMIELIFVIMILGIVSSIGAELIAKVYGNYIIQRGLYKSSSKTETVTTQIANRLAYAIPNTVISRLDDSTISPLENIPSSNYQILEWVGYDADSFGYSGNSGWSGFADMGASTLNTLSTSGSTLNNASTVINNLSGNINDGAVFFPNLYNVHNIGYQETTRSNTGLSLIASVTGSTITFEALGNRRIKEHYKLAWTAYAIVPTKLNTTALIARGFDSGDTLYDLDLYYNYRPWSGENYANGEKNTLLKNVSVFTFMGDGNTIRFKLCQQENVGFDNPVTTCKEKAVIR